MKRYLFITVVFIFSMQLKSQVLFDCIPEAKQFYTDNLVDKIVSCCNIHFNRGSDTWENKVIEAEILIKNDTVSIIIENSTYFDIIRRHPDATVKFEHTLVLLYSKNYSLANDSLWLDKVYNLCKETVININFEIVSWSESKFRRIYREGQGTIRDSVYPPKIKYVFLNNTLISKQGTDEMFHLYRFFPKNMDNPWLYDNDYYKIFINDYLVNYINKDSIK